MYAVYVFGFIEISESKCRIFRRNITNIESSEFYRTDWKALTGAIKVQ